MTQCCPFMIGDEVRSNVDYSGNNTENYVEGTIIDYGRKAILPLDHYILKPGVYIDKNYVIVKNQNNAYVRKYSRHLTLVDNPKQRERIKNFEELIKKFKTSYLEELMLWIGEFVQAIPSPIAMNGDTALISKNSEHLKKLKMRQHECLDALNGSHSITRGYSNQELENVASEFAIFINDPKCKIKNIKYLLCSDNLKPEYQIRCPKFLYSVDYSTSPNHFLDRLYEIDGIYELEESEISILEHGRIWDYFQKKISYLKT